MEFRDLKRQYKNLQHELAPAIRQVLYDGAFIGGEPVDKLEASLAEYVGVKHCITCANGTDALVMSLRACGVGVGDAVFVPDFTFVAPAEAVALLGATPIFVDVDEATFNLSPQSLERALEEVIAAGRLVPRALIAVDLFGLPADYPALCAIAKRYDLLLLEDGAQGFGGMIGAQRACSFGDLATTSFFPAKPLGCYGDGGAIFTDNDEWAAEIRSLKVHGKGADKYDNVRIGYNSRLDTIQAAVLDIKLAAFDGSELGAVQCSAAQYSAALSDLPHLHTPTIPDGYASSWAQYTLRFDTSEQRDALRQALAEASVPTMAYYPAPLSSQPAYRLFAEDYTPSIIAPRLCQTILQLPIHPYLTEKEMSLVIRTIRTALAIRRD